MTTLLRKMWKTHSKHKKLCEEWALAEHEGEGWWRESGAAARSEVRYAGAVPVGRAASAPATAAAVRAARVNAKSSNKKLQKVELDISPRGVVVTDADTRDNVLSVSIYRISFCSADAANARVFAVVEGGARGDSHTAHVFVCSRRRYARALALALAHAFNDAYQSWQASQASSLSGSKRLAPWVRFPDDDEEEADEAADTEQWQGLAPLVTFA
ncbi:low density lipoprotein receptor adapter protein 1 [Plutella xylostella]|uniref:low density lipoprotein receptor adapter protein 1 n=1 Tax=Plutella xylostella TaxID=51655 RepID=UPI002032FE2C|nr:low density lipoprotein receptor adapter protein 1 [Plutella xylostella]